MKIVINDYIPKTVYLPYAVDDVEITVDGKAVTRDHYHVGGREGVPYISLKCMLLGKEIIITETKEIK